LDWNATASDFDTTTTITVDKTILGQPFVSLLGSYVAKNVKIFVCPADRYVAPAQSALASSFGMSSRVRSCAMDGAMGDGIKYYSPAGGGPWNIYNVKKTGDMHTPSPSDCWVITDEHPDWNDDATLYVNPANANGTGPFTFYEVPGAFHGNGSGMFFADGHTEVHAWKGSLAQTPVTFSPQTSKTVTDTANINDLVWFAQHTPQN
jgi:prepilin-type processing-associated H-X9-DG protein